jgi:hypothetical protein
MAKQQTVIIVLAWSDFAKFKNLDISVAIKKSSTVLGKIIVFLNAEGL